MPITLTSQENNGQTLTAIKGCPVRYYFSTDSYFEPVFTTFYYEIGPLVVSDFVTAVEREYTIGAYSFKFTETVSSPKSDILFSSGMSLTDLVATTSNTLEGLMRLDYNVIVELRNSDTEMWMLFEAKCKGDAGDTAISYYDKSTNTTTILDDYSATSNNVKGEGGVREDYSAKLQVYIEDLYQYDMFLIPQGSMCYTDNTNAIPICIDLRTLLENEVYSTVPDFSTDFDFEVSRNTIKEFSWSAYDKWSAFTSEIQTGICDAWDASPTAYINRSNILFTSDMTIEYWIHLRGDGTQEVLGNLTGNTGITYLGGSPVFHGGGGNSVTLPSIPTNQWVHQAFAVTLGSNVNNLKYYQDGSLVGTYSVTIGSNPYEFGLWGTYSLGSFFSGDLAQFRAFTDIRTTQEIAANYDLVLPSSTPNLRVYYQFEEENNGGTVLDSSSFGSNATHITVSSATATPYLRVEGGPTCFSTSYTEQAPEVDTISSPEKFINAVCQGGSSDMSEYGYVNTSTLVKPLLILPEDNTLEICQGQPEVIYFYIPEEFNLMFPSVELVNGVGDVLFSRAFSFSSSLDFNKIHYLNLTNALAGLEQGDTATLRWTNTGIYGQYMEEVNYYKLYDSTDECCCTGYFVFLNSLGGYQTFPTTCTKEYGIEIDASTYCICEGCNSNEGTGQRFTNLTWNRRKRVFSRKMDLNSYSTRLIKDFFSSGDIRWYENGKLLPIRFNQNTRAIKVSDNTVQFEMTFNIAKTFTSLINS